MAYRIITPVKVKYSSVVLHMLETSFQLTKLNRSFTYYLTEQDNSLYDILTVRTDSKTIAHEIALLLNATINTLDYIGYE